MPPTFTALGFRAPLGHIDLYANGGTDQPGCPKVIFAGKGVSKSSKYNNTIRYNTIRNVIQSSCPPVCPLTGGAYFKCDHQRSVFLYLESLKQTCVSRAFPCSSYQEFLDGSCTDCSQFGTAGCPAVGQHICQRRLILTFK